MSPKNKDHIIFHIKEPVKIFNADSLVHPNCKAANNKQLVADDSQKYSQHKNILKTVNITKHT